MPTLIALLRGVNVGGAKRLAMSDFKALLEELGFGQARTLLASGNAVFTARAPSVAKAASRIEQGLADRLSLRSRVTVLTAAELAEIVAANPFHEICDNPSRLMIGVVNDAKDIAQVKPLAKQAWKPEMLAVGPRAVYFWVPGGVIESQLAKAIDRALRDGVTTRNWGTMQKLHAAAQAM